MRSIPGLLCVLLVSTQALAQESPPSPGFHEHDGFFLSLSTGPAYANIDDSFEGGTLEYTGWGASFDVRIGGTVARNLILSGDLMGWALSDPEVSGRGSLSNTTFVQSTFGAGLTYYFMPVNMFIAGTVGVAGFSLDLNGKRATTDKGLGIYLKGGKDWWVDADWALGVAAAFGWSSVKNSTAAGSEKLSGYSISVQFNATYQ